MVEKLSAAELTYIAITWAEESMVQMIGGCAADDPYRTEIIDQLKQLRAYRRRRYGKQKDPFEGAKLVNMTELRALAQS